MYDADSISILEGLEHIRKRPHMYIGSTDVDGLHHLLREVVDNAIDEYLDGHVSTISILINSATQTVEVRDNGRGIPVSKHKKAGISTLEAVFSKLHSGGKFKHGAYTNAVVGLHGIGVKAVNALSNHFDVWTVRKKIVWHISFKKGVIDKHVHVSDRKLKGGTIVKFTPDLTLFNASFNYNKIKSWLWTISCLCPELKIRFKFDNKKEVFITKNGIIDILTSTIENPPFIVNIQDNSYSACLTWSTDNRENIQSFVNVVKTLDHGMHVLGLRKAIQDSINVVANTNLKGDYIRTGLVAVIHAKVIDPQFRGQTKTRLENKEVRNYIYESAKQQLIKYWTINTDILDSIVFSAKKVASAWKKYNAERLVVKSTKVKKGAIGILPGKLVEAPDCPPNERELYICEGDSAEGIVTKARMMKIIGGIKMHYQEVYPLRGKIPNAVRNNNIETIAKNQVVKDLITAIGTGVGSIFSLDKSRYCRVYILADADPDGRHIVALLVSLFSVYMPNLIKSGMLFVVNNPLFMGISNKKRVYGDSLEYVKAQFSSKENPVIRRFKGLGESNPQELQDYAMADTRKVIKVVWDDATNDAIISYMGDDVRVRKTLLNI